MSINQATHPGDRSAVLRLAYRLYPDLLWRTVHTVCRDVSFQDVSMLSHGSIPPHLSLHTLHQVSNLRYAWNYLLTTIDQPLCWESLRFYHHLLGTDLFTTDDQIRCQPIRLPGTPSVPPVLSEASVRIMLSWILSEPDPVRQACTLFCTMLRDTWFEEGTLLTALMAANHCLLHYNVGVFAIDAPDLPLFEHCVHVMYETHDMSMLMAWVEEYAIDYSPSGLSHHQEQSVHPTHLLTTTHN